MVALSLIKVVCRVISVTPMDGSLVIMEDSMFSISLLLQWMVALSLWNLICCRDFYYSNGWYRCHYGWQSVVENFVTPMDGSLSLWYVVCFRYFCYSNEW